MTHNRKKFAFRQPGPSEVSSGDILERCNCSAALPHTPFGNGLSNLTFRDCKLLTNRDLPPGSIMEGNCINVHLKFCTNFPGNEWLIDKGVPACPADCEHEKINERDILEIDGEEVIVKRYYHPHKVVS